MEGAGREVRPFAFDGGSIGIGLLHCAAMCIRTSPPHGFPWRVRLALRALAVAILATLATGAASAEICKYADPEGNIHYSNVPPEKGWKRLGCTLSDDGSPPRSGGSSVAAARKAPTPPGFPKVDGETQRVRDDVRKKVLADELASEKKLLVEARAAYAEGAPPPLPEEKADADKYRARIARLRQTVSLHEKNVDALTKELSLVK